MSATVKSAIKARYETYSQNFAKAQDPNDKLIEADIFSAYLDGAAAILAIKGGDDAAAEQKVVEAARGFNESNIALVRSEDALKAAFE
jgi:hypothetical protein